MNSQARFLIAIFLAMAFMYVDTTRICVPWKEYLFFIRSNFQTILALPSRVGTWLEGYVTYVTGHQRKHAENKRLQQENLLLKGRLQTFSMLLAENDRLHRALGSSSPFAQEVAIAEIVSISPDPFSHRITLNKGKKQGVYVGQPIVDATGLMGQITETSHNTSEAIFITDPHHALLASVLRNGLRVLVMGTGSLLRLDIPFIPDASQLKIGDVLVTSPLGTHFPPGYPIAKITSIRQEPDQPFANISAKPLAELDRSEHALLIWPRQTTGTFSTATRFSDSSKPINRTP